MGARVELVASTLRDEVVPNFTKEAPPIGVVRGARAPHHTPTMIVASFMARFASLDLSWPSV